MVVVNEYRWIRTASYAYAQYRVYFSRLYVHMTHASQTCVRAIDLARAESDARAEDIAKKLLPYLFGANRSESLAGCGATIDSS